MLPVYRQGCWLVKSLVLAHRKGIASSIAWFYAQVLSHSMPKSRCNLNL